MDRKNSRRPLTEPGRTIVHHPFCAIQLKQGSTEKIFFHFVDKNPLFQDNSPEAICELILASGKRECAFKPHFDKNQGKAVNHLTGGRFHHRYK